MMPRRAQKTYEVEEVVGKRTENGVMQYRIKWKNYKTPSWQDANNCDCPEAIAKYEQKQKNNNGKSSQSSTPATSRTSSRRFAAAQADAGDGSLVTANQASNATGRTTRRSGVDAPSIDGSNASANLTSAPSTSRMSSRRSDAAQADAGDGTLATTTQPSKSTFVDRLTRRFSGAGGDSVLSAAGSTTSADRSSNSSVAARAATRGKSAAIIPKVDQTSSTDSRRSMRNNRDESSTLNEELAALIKYHPTITTPKGNRKRGAASSTASPVPVKILKPNDLKGINIWTQSAYSEWAKKEGIDLSLALDEKEGAKFLGEKIIGGLVAHFPHGKKPYFVIKTEAGSGKKQKDVTDVVHAVDCLLAASLVPKAVTSHGNFLACSAYEGDENGLTDGAGPSSSQ